MCDKIMAGLRFLSGEIMAHGQGSRAYEIFVQH